MKDFLCYYVTKEGRSPAQAEVTHRSLGELPAGDVLIRVAYSSLNYKDALSATGHPGVTRKFPHVPGIDAAGTVVESRADEWNAGDEVLATSYDLGQNTWGGYAEYVRVPAAWVVRRPEGLSLREAMILGTAGFTAGMGLDALVQRGITPARGEIVVTGASGGVGSLAVAILAKAGFQVVASTGKTSAHELLRSLAPRKSSAAKKCRTRATSLCWRPAGPAPLIPSAARRSARSSAPRRTMAALPPADWWAAWTCR